MNLFFDETIAKLTSIEQLLDVKNPGRNGGNGGYDLTGNWKYTKPQQNNKKPAQQTKLNSELLAKLKTNYINYFKQKESSLKKLYSVNNNMFIFPSYKEAIDKKLVNNEKEYEKLFKEQFILFSIEQTNQNNV